MGKLVRGEWFFLVSAASVAAFALFEPQLFSRLDNPLILTAILGWLFGVVLWSSLAVVRHAEHLAERLGEPYGTLLLTLTITAIEVVAISAVVRHGGPNPTLVRDTLLAVVMIIMNGMVGATLLIGGVKHREQTFNLQGANAYLSVVLPLATFALIMPDFTETTPGPVYSVTQQLVLVIGSLGLYGVFLALQTGRYHGYFAAASEVETEAREFAAPLWFSTVMMVAYMAAVVFLVDQFGPPLDYLLETLQAPAALGGVFIAILVAAPEFDRSHEGGAGEPDAESRQHFSGLRAGDDWPNDPLGLDPQPPHRPPDRPRRRACGLRASHSDACGQHYHFHQRPHKHAAGGRPSDAVCGLCAADLSGMSQGKRVAAGGGHPDVGARRRAGFIGQAGSAKRK